MKTKLFTVYDSKSEIYLAPFTFLTKGQAMRAFEDSVRDPQSQFNKHPEDYTLFEIGEYDDSTAEVEMHSNKIPLSTALEALSHLQNKQTQSINPNIININQEQH